MQTNKIARLLSLIAMLSTSLLSVQAQAAPWTFTTNGTIQDGYDTSGVFGRANTDLRGLSYSQTITVDPTRYVYETGTGNVGLQYGYGALSGMASDTVTVNGVSKTFVFDLSQYNEGESYLQSVPGFGEAYQYQQGYAANGQYIYAYQYVYSFTHQFIASTSYDHSLSYAVQAGDQGGIYFTTRGHDGIAYINGGMPQHLAITAANNIPEPASLALFALGLMAVGATRRKVR